jgi:hypothetical protein
MLKTRRAGSGRLGRQDREHGFEHGTLYGGLAVGGIGRE